MIKCHISMSRFERVLCGRKNWQWRTWLPFGKGRENMLCKRCFEIYKIRVRRAE